MHEKRLTMLISTLAVFQALITIAESVTLTYRLAPHERACFYTDATRINEKLGFYFSVQSGGQFDIDWEVLSPTGVAVQSGVKARQGDYVFPSKEIGEYAFCFSNKMSTFSQKLIDFDLSSEHEVSDDAYSAKNDVAPNALPHPVPGIAEAKIALKESVVGVTERLAEIKEGIQSYHRTQQWFRTREHRNFATVVSTESRIFWFSAGGTLLYIAIAVAQVYMIQIFFNKAKSFRI